MTTRHPRSAVYKNCPRCGHRFRTASAHDDRQCRTCRDELKMQGAVDASFSSQTVLRIVVSRGTCLSCHRDNQHLVNDTCDDCRFYADTTINASLSARARQSSGGTYDFRR